MAVKGKVTRDLMGPEPASPADKLDEAMREREASRMTSGVPLPEAQGTGGDGNEEFSSVVTVEMLDYQMDMSWRQMDTWKSPEEPGLSSKRGSD